MECTRNIEGTDLSRARRGEPCKTEILYKFYVVDERIPFQDILETLTSATTAMKGIYGEAGMQLETRVYKLCQERIIYIDGNTFLGQCLAKAFTALLNKAYCRQIIEIERVNKEATLAGMAHN